MDTLPTEMTVGGRAYDILSILMDGETSFKGGVVVVRAVKATVNLGQEECEHLMAHQGDIPVALQGKAAFVFTNWRRPGRSGDVACVYWDGDRWVQDWCWLDDVWYGGYRVLRRK